MKLAIVIALFCASCVMPGDFDRMEQIVLQGQADRIELKRDLELNKITAEQAEKKLEEIDAKVERETAELAVEVKERNTATLEAVKEAASDPTSLIVGAATSILVSIFGTNAMRNRSRKVEIAKLEGEIKETDKWIDEIVTENSLKVNP